MFYSAEELSLKLKYYNSLPEKARRHYLGIEYSYLGPGSQRYLSKVFNASRHTIRTGFKEIVNSQPSTLDYTRQRKAGGGRKKKNILS